MIMINSNWIRRVRLQYNHQYFFVCHVVCLCFYLLALVNCEDPGSPSNGQKRGSRYWTGESVSFLCDPGYHLTGPATRMCLPSGNWSGIQPSCK